MLLALFAAAPAGGQSTSDRPGLWVPEREVDLAGDLHSGRPGDRLFAAREIRRRLRHAERLAGRTGGDDLFRTEAQVARADLVAEASGPTRTAIVAYPNLRRPLADVLVLMGDPGATPALEDALEDEGRPAVRRRLERAIELLEE